MFSKISFLKNSAEKCHFSAVEKFVFFSKVAFFSNFENSKKKPFAEFEFENLFWFISKKIQRMEQLYQRTKRYFRKVGDSGSEKNSITVEVRNP